MRVFNIHEAKTHLSRILERVEKGEEVLIARNGTPIARLSPAHARPRSPGRLAGKIRLGDDFDDPLPPEVLARFRGDGDNGG